jgi:hypothetical protein
MLTVARPPLIVDKAQLLIPHPLAVAGLDRAVRNG